MTLILKSARSFSAVSPFQMPHETSRDASVNGHWPLFVSLALLPRPNKYKAVSSPQLTIIGTCSSWMPTKFTHQQLSSASSSLMMMILIRIALADVFAGGCPVLALDEPTTNLDVDKVENMATMLSRLVQEHPALQLIVITHDHDLVRHLH
uniref:ATPase_AAA_core domain-containing protein n=1 Tax=Panagrellus redivivus TaxID=6233 RepID=A0A7E4UZE0_PANRE